MSEREIDGGLEKGGVNTPGFALRGSPGRFTYTGQWQPNERYEVFVSENLRNWTELSAVTTDDSGLLSVDEWVPYLGDSRMFLRVSNAE